MMIINYKNIKIKKKFIVDESYHGKQHVLHIIWFTSPFDVLIDSDRCLD